MTSVKSLLLAGLIGLSGLPMPAAASTDTPMYGFCWVVARSSHPHKPGVSNFTTFAFPYDRWLLDDGRFYASQFNAFAASSLGITKIESPPMCEAAASSDAAVALLKTRTQRSESLGATTHFLSWVPHARSENLAAPAAPAPATPAPATAVVSAAPAQPAAPNRIADLGELAVDEQVNLAYFRESSCQQLAETRQSQAQKAREMDAEWAENARSRPSARKRNNWEWGRQEMAEMFRRSAVILESVRVEKGCS